MLHCSNARRPNEGRGLNKRELRRKRPSCCVGIALHALFSSSFGVKAARLLRGFHVEPCSAPTVLARITMRPSRTFGRGARSRQAAPGIVVLVVIP